MVSLQLASRNENKLTELRALLPGVEIRPLPAKVELPPERGRSFAENALAKARAAHAADPSLAALGEDSGIEARALGGAPGIRSARYAGEEASDEENLEKLLAEVGAAGDDRGVRYVCVLALIEPDGSRELFEGRCEGALAREPRGSGGFGYDPAFVPVAGGEADRRTMAELSAEEKNRISHRGAAARLLAEHLAGAVRTGR